MLFFVLFLTTVVGVNWAFCRSLFQETDSLSDRPKLPTHDASSL